MKFRKGGRSVSVPAHRILKPGTLRAILREAAIEIDRFLEAL